MKTFLLIFSLVANAALAVVYVQRHQAASDAATTSAAALQAGVATAIIPATDPGLAGTGLTAETAAALRGAWPAAKRNDLPGLIGELRAQGYPPEMIRAVVRALITEEFRPRWKELQSDDGGPFWTNPKYYSDPKSIAAMRELSQESTRRIKELLGEEGVEIYDFMAAQQQRKYGNLPPEKVRRAEEVLRDYNDLTSDVYRGASGGAMGGQVILLPEDREKLAYLEKQKREDLAKVLSPEELLEYDLRTSSTANQLRSQLMGFNPTEDEFRTLFKLQQAMDEKLGLTTGVRNVDDYRSRQAALKDLQTEVDAALGPERAADYKQATDPQYQQVNRLVARLELPASAAVALVNTQKDVMQRAVAIRSNQSLSAAERAAQLSALESEASGKISTALGGQRGLDAYKQYGGGWLQALARPMPTRPGM